MAKEEIEARKRKYCKREKSSSERKWSEKDSWKGEEENPEEGTRKDGQYFIFIDF